METHERQFIGSLDAELRDLDRRLTAAMRTAEPTGLCDRVEAACNGADAERLRRAMRVTPPAGLAQRLYVASVRPARRAVAGRVGWAVRVAVAACVALACGASLWFVSDGPSPAKPANIAWIEDQLLRVADELAVAKPRASELDDLILAFAVDVERTALSMDVDLMLDPLGADADTLLGDLYFFEADYDAF